MVLYQTLLVTQPDSLSAFFPTADQRYQYCHFFHETSSLLLVIPTSLSSNPFISHLSSLALGKPVGLDITHDTFRLSLLSLATWDIGFKMNQSLLYPRSNAMYGISAEHRRDALKGLKTVVELGLYKGDLEVADLIVGAVIALGIRDRLAGNMEWEEVVKLGVEVVLYFGGPVGFVGLNPTRGRRFLVEQMASVELLGALTTWVSPKLIGAEDTWLLDMDRTGESIDHLEHVYGWDRHAVQMSVKATALSDECRQIMMVEAQRHATPYPQIREMIHSRKRRLTERAHAFLKLSGATRNTTLMTSHPSQVMMGILANTACLELSVLAAIIGQDLYGVEIQKRVDTILEISDESMSRGHYAGLLLPLTWAASCSSPSRLDRSKRSLGALRSHYHLEHEVLDRLIEVDWPALSTVGLADWETLMRDGGYYLPLF